LSTSFEIDIQALLTEVEPGAPCGIDLEYDSDFIRLDAELQGKPEVQYGDTISAAIPPDWKVVHALAFDLSQRSRDLRLAVAMARSEMHLQGISGFAAALQFIEKLLETRWDTVHPQLDPDDDHDPVLRVNTISALVDRNSILGELKSMPIVASRAHGRFSLRDIDISTGDLQAGTDDVRVSMAVIDAAFMDVDESELQRTHAALVAAHEAAARIEAVLTSHVGNARSVDLSALVKVLKRLLDFVEVRHAQRNPISDGAQVLHSSDGGRNDQAVTRSAVSGDITNRQDVLRMLQRLNDYYAKHEPSSPIPLLLQRAERLIDKSFVEIMTDMAPDGLSQLYLISGTRPENE
jgi:type VI secretion system protein ImpA